MNVPDPKANTTTEAYLAYKAGYLEESELKPVLYEPYIHFDGWLAYWAGLVDYFPVKRSENGKNLMPILPGKISYRGLDVTVDEDGTITLNGHTTGSVTLKLTNGLEESGNVTTAWVNQHITDDVNGKCISFRYVSGSAPASSTALRLYGSSGSAAISQWYFQSDDQNTVFSYTSKASCLVIYANQGLSFDNYKFRVQLEDNSAPTNYIPYASVPEMLCDEEALVAYLSGVTDTYPEDIKDPYDVRIVGYLKYLVSARFGRPEYPVNNEEFYLSTMDAPHTSNETPSADIELDTSEGKLIDVKAYGDTFQQTYTGKNLLPNTLQSGTTSGLTYTVNSDGSIKLTGTATARVEPYLYYNSAAPLIFPAGTYKNTSTYPIILYANGYNVFPAGGSLTLTEEKSVTIAYFRVENTGTALNEMYYPQIIKSSVSDESYEPYVGRTASPNPDYPQDIQVVTGEQTVNVHGKNLLGLDNFSGSFGSNQYTEFGNILDIKARYGIASSLVVSLNAFKYTKTSQYDSNQYWKFKGLQPNTNYTISCNYSITTSSATNVYLFGAYRTVSGNKLTQPFTTDSNGETEFVNQFYGDAQNDVVELTNLMVEEGSATSYEPHQSQDYTVNLGSIELCKIGTYQDYIYKSGDDWYVHKELGSCVLDGTESWGVTDSGQDNWYYLANIYSKIQAAQPPYPLPVHEWAYSTHYINQYIPQGSNLGFAVFTAANTVNIRIKEQTEGTVADFKTLLAANLPKFYMPLATATDTQITDGTLIGQLNALAGADTYNEKTYIKVTANDPNLPALLKVEAYKY